MVKSGLQRQVLSIARSLLRASRSLPADSGVRHAVLSQLRSGFYGVQRANTRLIEHLVRGGERKLELLKTGAVKRASGWSATR